MGRAPPAPASGSRRALRRRWRAGLGPPLAAGIEFDGGVDPSSVESASHAIDVTARSGGLAVRLQEGPLLADRDFVLRWRPRPGAPALSPVSQEIGGDRYVLA